MMPVKWGKIIFSYDGLVDMNIALLFACEIGLGGFGEVGGTVG